MILPDVNILIHAYRSEGNQHALCREFIEAEIGSGRRYGISSLALSALMRITTDHRAYAEPSPVAEVVLFADALRNHPNCVAVEPGPRHWLLFRDLVIEVEARSKLVPDAYFAALAIEHGCEWVTLDRDFAKFPGLKWRLLT